MGSERVGTGPAIRQWSPNPVLVVLRLVLVALVARPAASKFLTYGDSVAFFDAFGVPAPAVMVIVAGLVEATAAVLLLAGRWKRLAALSLIPVMLVAILYVGPDWKNLTVLVGSAVLVVLGGETPPVRERTNRLFE